MKNTATNTFFGSLKSFALGSAVALSSFGFSTVAAADSIDDFNASWVGQAWAAQRAADMDTPLSEINMIGTHNSFNSEAYQTSGIRYLDPQQKYNITDQLRMGARFIELDVHWYTKMEGIFSYNKRLLLCHGSSSHAGCSMNDMYFREGLNDIRDFLRSSEGEDQVIILYIEGHMDGRQHKAADDLEEHLGEYLYPATCTDIPSDLTKRDILNAGAQVIVWDNQDRDCDGGSYDSIAFTGLGDISRVWEDATVLGSIANFFEGDGDNSISASEVRSLFEAGKNIVNFDNMKTSDGRIEAGVWSFRDNEPNNHSGEQHCGRMRNQDSDWDDIQCDRDYYFACKDNNGTWMMSNYSGQWSEGETACADLGGSFSFAVPVSAPDNQALYSAVAGTSVFLNINDLTLEGAWTPEAPTSAVSFTMGSVDENADATGQAAYCGGNSEGNIVLAGSSSLNGSDPSVVRMYPNSGNCYVVIQEEQSNDSETAHANESVDVIAFTEYFPYGETGKVSTDEKWVTVNLNGSYTNPVVVAFVATMVGSDPALAQVRNIGSSSFDLSLQEFDSDDGGHYDEEIHYVVLEEGTYQVGGKTLIAGTESVSTYLNGSATQHTVSTGLSNYKVVAMPQSQDSTYVVGVEVDRNSNSFDVGFMPEESKDHSGNYINGTIGYIVLED